MPRSSFLLPSTTRHDSPYLHSAFQAAAAVVLEFFALVGGSIRCRRGGFQRLGLASRGGGGGDGEFF